jgi:hypothetical protein
MTYCVDSDLLKYRPNILSLGVDEWSSQREEAYSIINRVIQTRWYRKVAPEMGYDPNVTLFDADLIRESTLTRLEAFKTLELAYMILMKDSPEADGFERNMKTFRDKYNEELELVLAQGIDYDWSGSGTFDDDEVYLRAPRRLVRA